MQALNRADTRAFLITHPCRITLMRRAAWFRTHSGTAQADGSPSAPRAPLQLRRAAARAHLMLPHRCPHITAECVNCTATS